MPLIAVVDDGEVVRNALLRLLRAAGFQAEGYANAAQFLAAAEIHRPDCLVTDLLMPKMTGMQLLLHVSKMRSAPRCS
jgi:two-component system, LuxR family, response regulator FixJ